MTAYYAPPRPLSRRHRVLSVLAAASSPFVAGYVAYTLVRSDMPLAPLFAFAVVLVYTTAVWTWLGEALTGYAPAFPLTTPTTPPRDTPGATKREESRP